ncbi:hypothetical protein [Burkholderia savannae]|uniref:hypothetical protein n=1 Tax=Burkholderia savannae TaxID=1637837 RepID=UPI0012E37A24|nr:hypothetical protein [Burkholderia savannae]
MKSRKSLYFMKDVRAARGRRAAVGGGHGVRPETSADFTRPDGQAMKTQKMAADLNARRHEALDSDP